MLEFNKLGSIIKTKETHLAWLEEKLRFNQKKLNFIEDKIQKSRIQVLIDNYTKKIEILKQDISQKRLFLENIKSKFWNKSEKIEVNFESNEPPIAAIKIATGTINEK